MFHWISKTLQLLIYPLNIAIILLIAAFFLLGRGDVRRTKWLIVICLALLYVPSIPLVSDHLVHPLETTYAAKPIAEYPTCDAVVVLGGSVGPVRKPRVEAEETGGPRVHQGARLLKAGKAPFVLVTGGGRYQVDGATERCEAIDMRDVLIQAGVDPTRVVLEDRSRSTVENAEFSGPILRDRGVKRILLVSNATHLRRATPLFEKQGFDVTPVPTGFVVLEPILEFEDFLPKPSCLTQSSEAVKEFVGDLVNRIVVRKVER